MINYFDFNNRANLDDLKRQRDEMDKIIASYQTPIQTGFQSDLDAKWIDDKNEVNNIAVVRDSIFMEKENPIFYLKHVTGETQAYTFTEYVELDEKDLKIKELEERIKELEGGKEDGKSVISTKSKQSNANAKQV